MLSVDDAMAFTISALREGRASQRRGYDVFTGDLIYGYLTTNEKLDRQSVGHDRLLLERTESISPLFLGALWELCRRGVLRPGTKVFNEGAVGNDTFGHGFSLTPAGVVWLAGATYEQVATVIPGRFVELLGTHQRRFGPGFLSRGAEAVRCYSAHAYLASCAMCGAAAESVVLALACERRPEAEVIKTYESAGGRGKIENLLIGQRPPHVQRDFKSFMQLLTYWRDEASHGQASSIGEVEAFTSLMGLLRLARYADEQFKP